MSPLERFFRQIIIGFVLASVTPQTVEAEEPAPEDFLYCEFDRTSLAYLGFAHRFPEHAVNVQRQEQFRELLEMDKGERMATAWDLLEAAAARGEAETQYFLGTTYFKGEAGLVENDRLALLWLRRAANQGYRDAQVSLIFALTTQKEINLDPAEAYKWFLLARSNPSEFGRDLFAEQMTSEMFVDIGEELKRGLTTADIQAVQQEARMWAPVSDRDPCDTMFE